MKYFIILGLLIIIGCDTADTIVQVNSNEPNRYSTPYPPELLSVTYIDSLLDILIVWKDNSDNEDGFAVNCSFRRNNNHVGSIIFHTPENMTECFILEWAEDDELIPPADSCRVYLNAFNRSGYGIKSNIITIPIE